MWVKTIFIAFKWAGGVIVLVSYHFTCLTWAVFSAWLIKCLTEEWALWIKGFTVGDATWLEFGLKPWLRLQTANTVCQSPTVNKSLRRRVSEGFTKRRQKLIIFELVQSIQFNHPSCKQTTSQYKQMVNSNLQVQIKQKIHTWNIWWDKTA